MHHALYISAAYVVAFVVMALAALKVWLDGHRYRRKMEALAKVQNKLSRDR